MGRNNTDKILNSTLWRLEFSFSYTINDVTSSLSILLVNKSRSKHLFVFQYRIYSTLKPTCS
uniref:Uncharacterized protein n=1 Tax=Octopus bimaculoides TaxID=37653 RepID=A0A0L8FGH7_OCTBM